MAITYRQVMLSIEDAYQLMLEDERQLKLYRIFAVLSRNGYYVVYQTDLKAQLRETTDQILKRPLDDEHTLSNKKCHVQSNNDTYKVATSMRPLSLDHLRRLNRVERKLISELPTSKSELPRSLLYCVKNSTIPVPTHSKLKPLFDGETKPLLSLGSIPTLDCLFTIMKEAGPKSIADCGEDNVYSKIDFEVFTSRQMFVQCKPMFAVVVVNEDDPFPSRSLKSDVPIYYALVSSSLEYNFFNLQHLMIDDEYPTLWRQHLQKL